MRKAPATKKRSKITRHPRVVSPQPPFSTVDEAVAEIAAGRMIIVVDDEDRENEGDLTLAAEACTPEMVAFIRKYASGVICVPMTTERLEQLDLPQMVVAQRGASRHRVHDERRAREGITTGISAADRARTIRVLADPNATAQDLVKPGPHVPAARA